MIFRTAQLGMIAALAIMAQGCCLLHCFDSCGDCMGCGEKYYGDWCENAPVKCNPCDRCGNYIGSYDCCCGTTRYDFHASGGAYHAPYHDAVYHEAAYDDAPHNHPVERVYDHQGEITPAPARREPTPAPPRKASNPAGAAMRHIVRASH